MKKSKNKPNKKQRNIGLEWDMGKPVAIEKLEFLPNGEVKLYADDKECNPQSTNFFIGLEKENGKFKQTAKCSFLLLRATGKCCDWCFMSAIFLLKLLAFSLDIG